MNIEELKLRAANGDAEEDEKPKRIGFFMQEDEPVNGNDVAAVVKK